MKKYLYSFIAAFVLFSGLSAQNCQNPVNNNAFQIQFNQIAAQQTNQKKLDKALEFVNSGCYLTQQIKNVAVLFTEDSYRLDYCKAAYSHTFDQVNFFDVYDAFGSFSNALRLYDFVKGSAKSPLSIGTPTIGVTTPTVTATNTVVTGPVFPNINYPNATGYSGKKGCPGPVMSDADFKLLSELVYKEKSDELKRNLIKSYSDQKCLSMAQVMKLGSLLSSEDMKFETLLITFNRVYDMENYQWANVLLPTPALQNKWMEFAKQTIGVPATAATATVSACSTSDADFKQVMNALKSKFSSSDKMATFELAAKDRCFSVAQLATVSKEFPFGGEKLKVFKTQYARCTDQSNYYKLVDELTFSSEKDELSNFIKKGGK